MVTCLQPSWKASTILVHTTLFSSSSFPRTLLPTQRNRFSEVRDLRSFRETHPRSSAKRRGAAVCGWLLPVDPWAPNIDSVSIASQLFAFSLFPYLGFLYFITKSKSAPKLTLFGFYFLLVFVGATIPAGIYAKVHYGTSLSNVDLLHGSAESLLTLTNLFIVLGLRQALRKARDTNGNTSDATAATQDEKSSI